MHGEILNFNVRQNVLIDFKAGGLFYTWNNKQQGSDRVCTKIDRILVNELWNENCREFGADFLPEGLMDHCPCIMRLLSEAVQQAWNSDVRGTDMFIMVKRLQKVKEALKVLKLTNFSSVESADASADAELARVQCHLNNDPQNSELIQMESDASIQLENGDFIQDPNKIAEAFIGFYKELLGTGGIPSTQVHQAVIDAGPIVNNEKHLSICREFTKEDVRNAVWSIEDDKAPEPDRFSSKFFKNPWGVVKNEVCKTVLGFFEHGQLLKQVNATTMTLVPKLDNATRVTLFRPIACCNVLYKIISKMLCERFKEVMPGLISENQSAFIARRSILDNILVCQDMLKEYNNKRKSPRCTIKVDLRKAYGSVHWSFIHDMLQALNFPSKFISWVMECVTSPSFSIMINGGLNGFFKGKRRIRQGDPMSPLVFVIVIEYLSRLLKKVGAKRGFRFHQRCKSLRLKHLIFADDLMLFSYADKKFVSFLVRALKAFEGCSGLQANVDKSAIYFGSVQPEVQQGIVTESGLCVLLPTSVILRITQLCRAFLWCGDVVLSKAPPIAWDWVCKSKAEGGLGIRDCGMWNGAALGKYVWKIAKKEDSLWVKWVHAVYIKEQDWWTYSPKRSAEYLSAISGCRELELRWIGVNGYGISSIFPSIRLYYGLLCMIDSEQERSSGNMMYVLKIVVCCVVLVLRTDSICSLIVDTVKSSSESKVQQKVVLAVLACVVYHIWFARNAAFWQKDVIHPSNLCKGIGRSFSVVVCVLPRRQQTASDQVLL
ncbi:uncharacterized protein LOC110721745 [Chenopodium quinoa]|uniref:uncharacterized protein LOC110721745 n=1 Tax=Chenopodium quinoa TaxID=63459 RepID=UPI000B77A1C8|nr:uncharacterized protein LOC110721745 [Chenopodium quinoa]